MYVLNLGFHTLGSCDRAVCTLLMSQLCMTAANTTRHTPHAVVYIVCSPDDGHNNAHHAYIYIYRHVCVFTEIL